jgi:hypothetical protein
MSATNIYRLRRSRPATGRPSLFSSELEFLNILYWLFSYRSLGDCEGCWIEPGAVALPSGVASSG